MSAEQEFNEQRRQMVAAVQAQGISDMRVLQALGRVPRHRFVAPEQRAHAYRDRALPLELGQSISQPFTVAYQTQWLEVRPGHRVLEIGTGSGYQAAILAELGAEVYSIERHGPLHRQACGVLSSLYRNIHLRWHDGLQGWPEHAPFDGILVTAGGAEVPPALLSQLRTPVQGTGGGRLVMPRGGRDAQRMVRLTCTGSGCYDQEEGDHFRFVPLLPGVVQQAQRSPPERRAEDERAAEAQ